MKKENLKIKDLTTTGEAVADSDEGIIFVDGALPQEVVDIEITETKKNYKKGRLLRIIKKSSHRVTPPCPYFGACGGCQIQHADTTLQGELKRNRVISALRKIGKIKDPNVAPCYSDGSGYGYRNKLTFPLYYQNGKKLIGFFKKRSHEIVDIDACMLHLDMSEVVYKKVKKLLLDSPLQFFSEKIKCGDLKHLIIRSSEKEKGVLIGLTGFSPPNAQLRILTKELAKIDGVKGVVFGWKKRDTNSIYPDHLEVLEGKGEIREEIIGVDVNISLFSFFQVNKKCAETLYRHAFKVADLKQDERVVDAYCGVGSFAIFLAKQNIKVTGIESFPKAVMDAKNNAKVNKVAVNFIEGEVEDVIQDCANFDVIFLNPPRKGVHEKVIDEIIKRSPKKIIYTSCDPSTLSRDIALLVKGGYTLQSVAPFDMFAQTMHVETIAMLEYSPIIRK